MHEWFNQIVGFVNIESVARAIAFAIIGGMALTQWIKFQFPEWLTDKQHIRSTRTSSSFMSFILCLIFLPNDMQLLLAASISMVVGLLVPAVYWVLAKVLYHYFPWMEDALSARPRAGKDKHV
jgi:hypothetical protein